MVTKKVLIVEDSETVRFEVKLLLDKISIDLIETSNEWGALNALDEFYEDIGLIIMDLTLKKENGFDLIKTIRSIDKYKEIPVLILTELSNMDTVLKAKEIGVNYYVRKPIQKNEFISRVKNVLGI